MVQEFDLGSVRGPQGPAGNGDMLQNVYDPNGKARDIFSYADGLRVKTVFFDVYDSDWNASTKQASVSVAGIQGAPKESKVMLSIKNTATAAQRDAWRRALIYGAGQETELLILGADGDTMQQKLDNGDFNGVDALSVMNHMYKMFVDPEDGHLKICIPDGSAPPPLSIDNSGHLIYTVSEETDLSDTAIYDLGSVRGPKGDDGAPGGMQASVYDPTNQATDIFAAIAAAVPTIRTVTLTAYASGWDDGVLIINSAYITANNNFDVDTAYTATEAQQAAWQAAKPKIISQASGSFTIQAFGMVPGAGVDIPLVIRVFD
ncbi:MAG: hypothetical protein K6B40_05325 [Firmicutes bacterium]|nr:hypothetical protein [Bacillota bacterium]